MKYKVQVSVNVTRTYVVEGTTAKEASERFHDDPESRKLMDEEEDDVETIDNAEDANGRDVTEEFAKEDNS
jgi:hypothetical protein